jgi:hypothetical protein
MCEFTYIHATYALSPKGSRGVSDIPPRRPRNKGTPTFYQNYLAMSNTADVTGGKPLAVLSQSITGVIIRLLMSILLGHRPSLWIIERVITYHAGPVRVGISRDFRRSQV